MVWNERGVRTLWTPPKSAFDVCVCECVCERISVCGSVCVRMSAYVNVCVGYVSVCVNRRSSWNSHTYVCVCADVCVSVII